MLHSPMSCPDRELKKSPEGRKLNRKLNITWYHCVSKKRSNGIKLVS